MNVFSADVRFLKEYGMILSHIGSTQEYEVILKLETFSHQSDRSFRLRNLIGLDALSAFIFSHHKK